MTASDDPQAPSMDAILASIKRIIAEEAVAAAPATLRRVNAPPPADDVLDLTEEAEPLVSPKIGETSRASLDALSVLVVTPDRPAPDQTGGGTLEGLVRELLRPMLAEWLDAKLPAMVERLVAVEIERITRRN